MKILGRSQLESTSVNVNKRSGETKTYGGSTLSIWLQLLTTSEDSYDSTRLRNHVHHSFHGGRTFHKTFPTAKDRRGTAASIFTMIVVRYAFPVPGRTVGVFVFPVVMCVPGQRSDFQHI
jgi:hypothetical protein